MFEWITTTVSAVGDVAALALEPPISYFLGLGLIGGVIAIVKRVIKKR